MRHLSIRRSDSRRRRKADALAELDMRGFQKSRDALGRAVLRATPRAA